MVDSNLSFVRTEMLQGQTPPLAERGVVKWVRTNLFATPIDFGTYDFRASDHCVVPAPGDQMGVHRGVVGRT